MQKKILIFTILSFLFASCASKQLVKAPSDAEINAEAAKAYQEVKSKAKLSNNARWNAMVQRVSKRIQVASQVNFDWETILIESPEVNAWCMPGGKMAVYTGIMPVAQNEAALAAIMGHEVAHATLKHGKQRYARAINQNLLGLVVGGAAIVGGQLLCKTESCKLLSGLGGAAAGFAIAFFDRKFSREDETEADQAGQIFMARAGYDPSEASQLWVRMQKASGGKAPPEFMSTHPSSDRRQGNLKSWLSEADRIYQNAPVKYGLGEKI